MDNKGSWCQVWGPDDKAIAFNPLEPSPEMVDIHTIAHALSMQCRFIGHVKEHFSVAQHCIMVSQLCDENDALWGLLHDASEAYLVDIPRPQKKWEGFSGYMELERVIMSVICAKFGLPEGMPHSVVVADDLVLQWEIRDNLQDRIPEIFPAYLGDLNDSYPPLIHMGHKTAELGFLRRFKQLMARRGG